MSAASTDPKSVRLRGRWVVVILAASLILNVFFVAAFLPKIWRGDRDCGRGDGVRAFMHNNADVKELGRKLRRDKRDDVGERRTALRAAYQDYVAAIRAEPFDAERFAAAQSAYVDARRSMRSLKHEWMQRLVGDMTPDQRRRFAEHLEERAACRAERWKRWKERREERGE